MIGRSLESASFPCKIRGLLDRDRDVACRAHGASHHESLDHGLALLRVELAPGDPYAADESPPLSHAAEGGDSDHTGDS